MVSPSPSSTAGFMQHQQSNPTASSSVDSSPALGGSGSAFGTPRLLQVQQYDDARRESAMTVASSYSQDSFEGEGEMHEVGLRDSVDVPVPRVTGAGSARDAYAMRARSTSNGWI
ncbi:choline-sulfatase [Pseudohyphozyma bogoriensis]|nr:choline-sulfatase [Pseudohyphozyma bogoriensis]